MNSGRAATFRDLAIEHLVEKEGQYPWETLKDFSDEFRTEFLPVAEREESLVKLEGKSYFQKPNESVDTYIDGFRELIKKAALTDSASIVVKFRRGLQESLAQTLADSSDPPSALDLEAWYARSRKLEQSRTMHRTIAGTRAPPPQTRPSFLSSFKREAPGGVQSPAKTFPPPAKPSGFSFLTRPPPATSSPSGSVPMDLDATRARARGNAIPSDVCRRCKKPGHWANECPQRYDIRLMDADELEEFLALSRDMAELRDRQALAESVTEVQEENAEAQEDFGTTSG